MDTPYALLVLVKSSLGVGLIGSVHMAHRQQEAQYTEQLVAISVLLDKVLPQWTLLGGDWNRDIITHAFSLRLLKVHNLVVVPMDNSTHLPKDFIVLAGIPANPKGKWLKQIGDHPVVWAQVTSSLAVGEGDIGSRPITPTAWEPIHRHWFANTLEAINSAGMSSKMWMHQYREITVAVNNVVEDQQNRKKQELDLVAV